MTLSRQWFLILFALILSVGPLFAADGAKAERAYNAAVAAFQDGDYSRSGLELAQFIGRFPNSTNVPTAVLLEAQSAFEQRDYNNAISLLTENMAGAGTLADQYIDWIGEAQFAGNDFTAAAGTFGSLVQRFPDSSLRLRATVEQAAALASAWQWQQVILLLGQPNGVFQHAAKLDPSNDLVSRGYELLAQAMYIKQQYANEWVVLNSINPQILTPDLFSGLERLSYQLNMQTSNFPAADMAATNLFQAARIAGDNDLMAESAAMRANTLEQMGSNSDAIAVFSGNLTTNTPLVRQRQAILEITRLAIKTHQFSQAETDLENYLMQSANSSATDVGLFSLADLQLKDHANEPAETNLLAAARSELDELISTYTNSPLLGEAYLDRGWSLWLEQKYPESLINFQAAATLLPPTEDLAVAYFKTGDAEFANTNYSAALTNYYLILTRFTNYPAVKQELEEPALYQILRASLEITNSTDAAYALAQIETNYPIGELTAGSDLLYAENLAESGHPATARALFQKFAREFPGSPLRPEAEFAVARSYALQNDWPRAITAYQTWLEHFPTNDFRPQAEFALALANFQAGNETNAFVLFTNFVAQFTNNSLAPDAQWWIADHFFRLGGTNYVDAEENYEFVYQNFPGSRLAYPAQFMAGRAAAAREDYSEAVGDYITLETELETNFNSPAGTNSQELLARTLLADGQALMQMPSPDTNNPLANFQSATNVFTQLCQRNPNNEFGALGWFYAGNCELQLTNYAAATNDYAQVLDTNIAASVSTRSMAQIGLGEALEKMSAASGTNQTVLLRSALDNYLDVFYGYNLRDGENPNPFWTNEAGLKALPLIETLGIGDPNKYGDPNKFITTMENYLPQMKNSFEKLRAAIPPPQS